MSGIFFLFPQQVINSTGQQFVLDNAAVTTDGYQVISGFGSNEITLLINIKNAPSGTNPTITFTMQEVDPIDQTTLTGTSVSSAVLNTIGVTQLTMSNSAIGTVKISWHITGTNTPVFTGVNVTVLQKIAGSTVEVNGNFPEGTVITGNINPIVVAGHDSNGRSSVLNVDGYGNLKVITQAVPSGTTTGIAFGQANTGAQAGTLTPLRATTYTEQTTNGQRSLRSTNANDSGGGTGAQTVQITYFDASLNGPFTETVTLNGLTAVATINNNICFIENMIVQTAGSLGSNQGTISLYTANNGTGTVIGSIGVGNIVTAGNVGDNRTLWAHHYVGTGHVSYLTIISGGTTGNQTGIEFIRSNNPLIAGDADIQISGPMVIASNSSTIYRPATIPLTVNGPARITRYAVSNGTNTTFYGSFEFSDA